MSRWDAISFAAEDLQNPVCGGVSEGSWMCVRAAGRLLFSICYGAQ